MKILHIWDQAGVGCILAKYQRNLGHDVRLIKRGGYDPYGILNFYNEIDLDIDGGQFIKTAIKEAKNYDIVHIHSLFKIVPELRKKYKDEKRLILHYHGSEIRSKSYDISRVDAELKADAILTSTPDLVKYIDQQNSKISSKVMYIPNPVDIDHFKYLPSISDRAFTIKTHQTDIEWALDYMKKNNINLSVDIIDRVSHPILYKDIPSMMRNYGLYVDLRYIDGVLLENLSKTALEALACGLKVLYHNLEYVESLPERHNPLLVTNMVLDAYT